MARAPNLRGRARRGASHPEVLDRASKIATTDRRAVFAAWLERRIYAAVLVEEQATRRSSMGARSSPRRIFERCSPHGSSAESTRPCSPRLKPPGGSRWARSPPRRFPRRSRHGGSSASTRPCSSRIRPRWRPREVLKSRRNLSGPEHRNPQFSNGASARASALADLWSGRPGQSCWLRRAVHRCDSGVTRSAEPRRWCGPDRGPDGGLDRGR
jgi:hypothetical protein